jgi:TonB family protein
VTHLKRSAKKLIRSLVYSLVIFLLAGCASSSSLSEPKSPAQSIPSANRAELEDIRADRKAAEQGTIGTPVGAADLGPNDSLPSPVYAVPPEYSPEFRSQGIRGRALVGFYVERDGTVQTAYIVTQTDEKFGVLGLACMKKWKFTPGIKNEVPVRVRMQVPIEFSP